MKRNKHRIGPSNGTATPATEAVPAVDAVEVAELPLPEVANLPPSVTALAWVEKLTVACDYLTQPRRFLARAVFDAAAASDPQTQVRADRSIDYAQLRAVLDSILPDNRAGNITSNRRLQRMFVLSHLNELDADELATALSRLVNRLIVFGNQDRPGLSAWGDDNYEARKKQHVEHVQTVIEQIDEDINAQLATGARDERIVVIRDLPQGKLLSLNSEDDLYLDLVQPLKLSGLYFSDVPEGHALKKLDPRFLPRLGRTGSLPVVVLSSCAAGTLTAYPRPWSYLATAEDFSALCGRVWRSRYRSYLDQNRESEADYQRFRDFEELCKQPIPKKFAYPAAPNLPNLDGFAARCLTAIDITAHVGRWIVPPLGRTPLSELLMGRRVLVSEIADQAQSPAVYGAKEFVGRFYTSLNRDALAENLHLLARSTLSACEELELSWRDAAIAEYQQRTYRSKQ